ncbi:hypothetical protein Ahy_A03g013161 [Arachis hypogaea]|uniref:PB1-like domain-containing protein n=1 Tax=Arachis hypogaea TaxID=3818 RepID=A0A445DUU4_ARAHY|nr:hypothetical protein Ahy_A03g013161 [Arachis hypogaea]
MNFIGPHQYAILEINYQLKVLLGVLHGGERSAGCQVNPRFFKKANSSFGIQAWCEAQLSGFRRMLGCFKVENSGPGASLLSSPSYTELGRLVSLTQMGDPLITIIFHHGGSFMTEADGSMSYLSGEICELPDIYTDTLDVFFVRDYHKKIGYDKVSQTWWLVPNRPLQTGLRAIIDYKELMEMCYLAQQNNGVIHVYYEHGVSEPVYIEEAEPMASKGKELMLIPTIFPTPKPTTMHSNF